MIANGRIVGHSTLLNLLSQDIKTGNLAHAYLFYGEKGLGKFTIAKWFASQILARGQTDEEKEESWHLISKNIHPDCLVLDRLWVENECTNWNIIALSSNIPQDHRAKSKIKTNVICIEDIRAIQERLYETSHSGKTCCLIRSIERLHITAANALLKILEEPPQHVIFCFTTERLGSILPTVASRMRIIRFFPLSNGEISPLMEDMQEEDRSFLLHISQGKPGVALKCMEDTSLLRTLKQAHSDARRFLETHSLIERFRQANKATADENSAFFLNIFLHLRSQLQSDRKEEYVHALKLLRKILQLLHILQSNTNKRLLAEHVALRCGIPG